MCQPHLGVVVEVGRSIYFMLVLLMHRFRMGVAKHTELHLLMHAGMTCSQLEHVLSFYGLNNLCIGLNTFPSQK